MSKIKVHVDLFDSNYFPAHVYFHHEKQTEWSFLSYFKHYSVFVWIFFSFYFSNEWMVELHLPICTKCRFTGLLLTSLTPDLLDSELSHEYYLYHISPKENSSKVSEFYLQWGQKGICRSRMRETAFLVLCCFSCGWFLQWEQVVQI